MILGFYPAVFTQVRHVGTLGGGRTKSTFVLFSLKYKNYSTDAAFLEDLLVGD